MVDAPSSQAFHNRLGPVVVWSTVPVAQVCSNHPLQLSSLGVKKESFGSGAERVCFPPPPPPPLPPAFFFFCPCFFHWKSRFVKLAPYYSSQWQLQSYHIWKQCLNISLELAIQLDKMEIDFIEPKCLLIHLHTHTHTHWSTENCVTKYILM